jgi:hypothetical protein
MPQPFGPTSRLHAASNFAQLPAMVRNPDLHILEIQSAYTQLHIDCTKMSHVLAQFQNIKPETLNPSASASPHFQKHHVRYQTGCATVLSLALIFNAIIYSYSPSDDNILNEAEALVDSVITLTRDASQYRPLSASFMPVPIVFSLAITKDDEKRAVLEHILREYEVDFVSANWTQLAMWMRERMKNPHDAFFSIILPQFEGLRRKAFRCHAIEQNQFYEQLSLPAF